MKGPFNKKMGAALLLVGAATALLALRLTLGEVDPARALAALRRVQGEWWALPAYLACYVALTTALLPAVLFHMAVGAAYGFRVAIWINLLTFNVTSLLQFAVARRAGRERVKAFLARRGVTALDELSRAHGLLGVILVRLVPIPAMVVATGLGVAPVRFRHYALGLLIGAFPYIAVYTYFAAALVEGAAGVEREARWHVGLATGVVLLVALAGAAIRSRLSSGRVRANEEPPDPPAVR